MTSFDHLSSFGSELSGDQLTQVDGGILPVLIVIAVGVGFALAVAYVD